MSVPSLCMCLGIFEKQEYDNVAFFQDVSKMNLNGVLIMKNLE